MADCKHCGQSAGILKKAHKECEEKHNHGRRQIRLLIGQTLSTDRDFSLLAKETKRISSTSFISGPQLKELFVSGYEEAVESAFEDGVVTDEEEGSLDHFQEYFSLSQSELNRNGALTRLTQGAVIREVLEGILPQRMQVNGQLPFNLQKSEKLVWLFQGVDYYEVKTRTHYVGGSKGVSIRIAKGLYFRTSGFKGEKVQSAETVHSDTGLFGVTNKHLYFSGQSKGFRIRYNKIVSFEPYADGIGVQRDAMTAKPQCFVTGDGWFTYNLITNLARL